MRCSVVDCINDTKTTTKCHGITFHLFPRDSSLRAMWVKALGLTDWKPKDRSTICSEHFRDEDFYETKSGLRKIKGGAVPTVTKDCADELDEPAAFRVCRICLAIDVKMYDMGDYSLDDMYEQITGILIVGEERLPQRLCYECAARLSSAIRFKNRATRSLELLQEMLLKDDYVITIRDIMTLSYTHNDLKSPLVQKVFDDSDHDLHIRDVFMKDEDTEDMEVSEGGLQDEGEDMDEGSELEVKNEDSTEEIFIEKLEASEEESEKELSGEEVEEDSDEEVRNEPANEYNEVLQSIRNHKKNYVKHLADDLDMSLFTVTSLSYEQQIEEVRERQHRASYRKAPYKCTVCYRGYEDQTSYDVHALRHSEKCGQYECFVCKTRLKSRRALRLHLSTSHTELYSCNGCTFLTKNRGVAREHAKWHAGTTYQCKQCYEQFDKRSTYLGHIRIKHVSDFVCELCGYTFLSEKGIYGHKKKKHVLEHSMPLEGPYCDVCEVKFISEDAFDRHLMLSSKHSSDHDPDRIRNSFQSMNRNPKRRMKSRVDRRPVIHRRRPEDGVQPNEPLNCEQCDLLLPDLRSYAQHFRRIHPDKNRTKFPSTKTPCMCELCGKIFPMMSLLESHMWVHTGEKLYKCDRCPKGYTQKAYLIDHLRIHSDKKITYECPICGKHFANVNNRRRHMFLHTGLKPFKCEICGKCSTTLGEQKIHFEHVHQKKPWPKRTRSSRGKKRDDSKSED